MSDSGFANDGLGRLHDRMTWHVERGQLPGLMSLAAHNGEPHVDVVGTPSFDDPSPLRRDAIFRIASLTKPITAAVAMMLVDDGVLDLGEAVDQYLPELADRRVLRELGAALDDTVPAKRAITVDDLLSSGSASVWSWRLPARIPSRSPSRRCNSGPWVLPGRQHRMPLTSGCDCSDHFL